MIESVNQFINHFSAIACNFKWVKMGHNISANKKGQYYDPITALVQISKGQYLARDQINKTVRAMPMNPAVLDILMKILYNPDIANNIEMEIRKKIEIACGCIDDIPF